MKNIYLFAIIGVLVIGGGFFYLQTQGKKQSASSQVSAPSTTQNVLSLEDGTYTVLSQESAVQWEGKKPLLLNYKDTGTLGIKSGTALIEGGALKSGFLTFDMTTIVSNSTGKGKGESMLSGHLKSDAFFNVEQFPEATFTFKEAVSQGSDSYILKGDLTIKGISNLIEIPAKISTKDGQLFVNATAEVDRTKWDIRFGSNKFFDNLADNVIDDFFSVTFSLRATRS